jgi:hypothetical protein
MGQMTQIASTIALALTLLGGAGCVTSAPGAVRASADNPIVTIGAGEAKISAAGDAWRVWYVIDTKTRTCWMKLGDSAGQMSCCDLQRVPEARPHLQWISEGACAGAAQPGVAAGGAAPRS